MYIVEYLEHSDPNARYGCYNTFALTRFKTLARLHTAELFLRYGNSAEIRTREV